MTNYEESMQIDTGITLELLEEMQSAGKAGVPFNEALVNMSDDTDITNKDIVNQLRYAHDIGMDDGRETVKAAVAEEEKVFTDEETKQNALNFLDPTLPFILKHLFDESPINGQKMTNKPISEAFEEMKAKVMGGDKTYLYDCILSQMGQMQQMTVKLNGWMSKTNKVDTIMKYSNMHMKLMSEQRRTIQALDDLMNPKKTTFVKEVSQHNHFSEKKGDKPSELPATKEEDVIDAETFTTATAGV